MFRKQFTDVQDAWSLAQAIVDTVREPLLVLDENLRLVAANQSFYLTFKVKCENTQAKLVYELGDGIFPSFVCCWKRFFPNTESLKTTKLSMISLLSAGAPCS